jgi:hypothetical protein
MLLVKAVIRPVAPFWLASFLTIQNTPFHFVYPGQGGRYVILVVVTFLVTIQFGNHQNVYLSIVDPLYPAIQALDDLLCCYFICSCRLQA